MYRYLGNYSYHSYSVLTYSVADKKALAPLSEDGQDSVLYGLK